MIEPIHNEYVRKVIKDGLLEKEFLIPFLQPQITRLTNFLNTAVYSSEITAEQRIEAYSKLLTLQSVLDYVRESQQELLGGYSDDY